MGIDPEIRLNKEKQGKSLRFDLFLLGSEPDQLIHEKIKEIVAQSNHS
jgi:hypothetical protein